MKLAGLCSFSLVEASNFFCSHLDRCFAFLVEDTN
uniref:Uncharacterized protein n=1 Tax=Arundo donax TaxID=35708 RepID=A0A0A9CF98_ARUDO